MLLLMLVDKDTKLKQTVNHLVGCLDDMPLEKWITKKPLPASFADCIQRINWTLAGYQLPQICI